MKPTKLHILFVSTWFPSENDQFSGDFVQRHAKAASLTHQVSVLHVEGIQNLKKIKIQTQKINPNYSEILVYFPKKRFSFINLIQKFRAYNLGKKQIPSFDLIHANVIYYNLLWVYWQKIKHKIPYVITEHSTEFHSKIGLFKSWIYRLIGNNANYILPVSQQLQKAMMHHGISNRYAIIPNVVDTQKFRPKSKGNHSKTKFLHISMLKDEHKNISGQLQAIKILAEKGNDFEYHIGGNGNLQPILEFAQKHNLQNFIKPFGTLSHAEVAQKMNEADAFVLFSFKENQPCVIIESFSVGTPVISTNVGGISEFFPDQFGFLINSNQVDELVDVMEKTISGKEFASQEIMHTYVEENFSENMISQKFDKIYKQILKEIEL